MNFQRIFPFNAATVLRRVCTARRIYSGGYITSKAIDNLLFRTDEDFEFMLDSVLRTVKFMGGTWVLPLTTHTISQSADWGIAPQRLECLLRKVKELKLQWYRYSDFVVGLSGMGLRDP